MQGQSTNYKTFGTELRNSIEGDKGFPGGSVVKNPPANAGDVGLIPGSGRSPGEGNGHPLQCSGLENPMDRGARQVTVHGVAKSQTGLSDWAHTHTHTRIPLIEGRRLETHAGRTRQLGKGVQEGIPWQGILSGS